MQRMSEPRTDRPLDFSVYEASSSPRITAIEIIAASLSLLWLLGVAGFFLSLGGEDTPSEMAGGLRLVMILMAVFLPIALIWVAASVARTARVMREEADRLQTAISAVRHAYIEQTQTGGMGLRPHVEKKLDEIAQTAKQTESAVITFASRRTDAPTPSEPATLGAGVPPDPVPRPEAQPSLELGTPAEVLREPISVTDFILAANFPETAEDKDGFRALRLALEDRTASKLIRSAQDVLTLLSQDGIYMDDLRPERARPEVWRKFAAGERGKSIAALGGIRDRSCLSLTDARMKNDPIFRDAVHHFLRQFDRTFQVFEAHATDEDIVHLAETRSARAFMLLGRVTGTFE